MIHKSIYLKPEVLIAGVAAEGGFLAVSHEDTVDRMQSIYGGMFEFNDSEEEVDSIVSMYSSQEKDFLYRGINTATNFIL